MSNIGRKQKVQEHTFSTSDISLSHAIQSGNVGNIIDGNTATECRLNTSGAERGFFTFNLGTRKRIDRIIFKHGKNDKWRIELSNTNGNFMIDKEVTFSAGAVTFSPGGVTFSPRGYILSFPGRECNPPGRKYSHLSRP